MSARETAAVLVQLVLILTSTFAARAIDYDEEHRTFLLIMGLCIFFARIAITIPNLKLPAWIPTRGFAFLVWLGLALATTCSDQNVGRAAVIISAALLLGRRFFPGLRKVNLSSLGTLWLGLLILGWLALGYFTDIRAAFFAAMICVVALLAYVQLTRPLNPILVHTFNSLILIVVGLPIADRFYQAHSDAPITPQSFQRFDSFIASHGDPKAGSRAMLFIREQIIKMWDQIYEDWLQPGDSRINRAGKRSYSDRPTDQRPTFRLRPNAHGMLMNCPVSVNSNGFRGHELSRDTNIYRIVAIGESTTFGITLNADDKPWPDVLEELIRQRIKTRRPVEVVNAGVPAYTIFDNLARMDSQILPVHPDMIISYHGANGFYLIDGGLIRPIGAAAPIFESRPLKIAADFEYRIRSILFFQENRPKVFSNRQPLGDPMHTRYAEGYRKLIQVAATNHVHLMLANYCTAVNSQSDPRQIAFYQGFEGDPLLWRLEANMAHSEIIRRLTKEHPEIGFIDTHPGLDGRCEKFIDFIHFTQEGRRQMAENMFAGIKDALQAEIGQ